MNAQTKEKQMKKKYTLTKECRTLPNRTVVHRIKALRDFGCVKKGEPGGWIECEANLSHDGNCWVSNEAGVYGNAQVYGDALVCDKARVSDEARVYGYAHVSGNARVYDNALVCDKARVSEEARIFNEVEVYDNALIRGNAKIYGNAYVGGEVMVYDNACVYGKANVYGEAYVYNRAKICGKAQVHGAAEICGNAVVKNVSDYMVFKNAWSSGRWFTYTASNKMWKVGCFYGTGEELIAKAKKDSKLSGKCYAETVKFVKTLEKAKAML